MQSRTFMSERECLEIQCPAGCGLMDYKTRRNMKIRVFDPLGYAMMIAGLLFIVAPDNLPFDFFTSNVIVNMGIGVGLLILGARRASLVTTDLSCNTCKGVILESKSIDQRLKGDLLGLSENKAEYIRAHFHLLQRKASTPARTVGRK